MKIVCIGDSLTEGIGVRKEEAWPFLLQKKLTVVIVNRGISGDTTTGMLGRFYYDVILCKPTHVVIMGGVNDLWWNLPIHLILSNIYSMFKQAIYHGIIPVIGIPTPIFFQGINQESVWEPVAGYTNYLNQKQQYIRSLMDLVKENNLLSLNFNQLFLDDRQNVIKDYFQDGDGVHPNKRGHQAIAQLAFEQILLFSSK